MSHINLCRDEEIQASGTYTSGIIQLHDGMTDHALELKITGDGTISVAISTSISGVEFIDNGTKGSSLTDSSGPHSDGKG